MRIPAGLTATTVTLLGMALAAPWPAVAQESGWSGAVDLGFRHVSKGGNEDKYREDVNLDQGLRLFNVELSSYAPDSTFMDEFRFSASGLGGDPHTRAGLRLRKAGKYDLQIGYRASDYFYRDAGYFFSDTGDLHTWNSKREFYDLSLSLQVSERVTIRLGAERMNRDGKSQTSAAVQRQDPQRDVFQLAQPVDQEATSFWLGADFHWAWADLTVEQRFNNHENRWLQTVASSDGVEPGGSTLDSYRLLQVQDTDTPVTRLQLAGNPHEQVRFVFSYAYMDADADYDVDGDWEGVDFTSTAFQTVLTNSGSVSREADLADLEVTWSPVVNVDLTADISYRSYDQDGSIDFLETQTGGAQAGNYPVQGNLVNELDMLTYGLAADWRVSSAWTLLAGVGMQTRESDFDLTGPKVETDRTIFRGGVGYRPNGRVDLRLVLEAGEDDDPLTQVSPTDMNRLTFRGRLRPRENLHLSFHFKDETRENLLSYPLGVPTDDVPPATEMRKAEFDVTSWGAFAGWTPGRFDLSLGYTRTEIDANADIVYLTGFTLPPALDLFTTLDQTGYTSDQDSVQALARMTLGKNWSAGVLAALSNSDGTYPVDWSHLSAHVRYQLPKGLSVKVAWHNYELDETNPYAGTAAVRQPDINDYDTDLWTVAVGYTF